ncbi:MAG: Ig-like domain-containing protein, partial [Oscillospiraceae bacterium]
DGGTIHIPAVGDNVEFCDLKTDNGCISANRLGNVKYRFTVHETGYYNLNMDIGWAVTNPSSGAEVALKVDDRNSVVLTEQNMNFLGDTPNADQKQYAYRKQIYFETGIHTILFTSSRGEMPWCSFFFFGGLELNKNDNDNTALAEDLYEAEDAEPVDKYTADISLAAIDAYQVENFDKENDDHYAASLQGASLSYELNVLSEQAAYYWLYLNTDLTGSAEITIDGKPLVLFDGYMKEYSLIKGQPCSQHKVYKYYRPVQLTAGKHVLKVTNLGGSIWFGGLEFVNAGKPTSEYGAALTRKGVKKGRQVLMTVGSRTDKGVYVMDVSFKVQYTSSDKTVASVDKNGRVEAISPGTAVIKAVLTSKDGSVVEYSDKLHVLPYFKGRISVKDASYDAQQGSLKAKVGAFYNQKQTEALVIAAVYGYDKANGMIGNLKFLQSETVSGMLADTECEIDFPVGSIDENTLVKLFVVDSSTPLGLWSYTFCREGSI